MEGNEKHLNVVSWIAIIISVIIASVGIMLGSIRSTTASSVAIVQAKQELSAGRITALELKFERIDERLKNIQETLEKHAVK